MVLNPASLILSKLFIILEVFSPACALYTYFLSYKPESIDDPCCQRPLYGEKSRCGERFDPGSEDCGHLSVLPLAEGKVKWQGLRLLISALLAKPFEDNQATGI